MPRSRLEKVAVTTGGLLAMATNAAAVEAGGDLTVEGGGGGGTPVQAAGNDLQPSGSFFGEQTQSYLTGSILTEGIYQTNYTDGNDDANDRVGSGWLRANIGARIELQDRVEAKIGVVYEGEFGDRNAYDDDQDDGDVAVDEAWILLKKFLGANLHARIGRMPVNWNLRKGYGGFMLDSRANRPLVTSWDGVRGYIQLENWTISPYYYLLDEGRPAQGLDPAGGSVNDTNSIIGITLDWQPDQSGDDTLFISGTAMLERNVPVDVRNASIGATDVIGDELITYQVGAEWALGSGFTVFGEFAAQDGDLGSGEDFSGLGWYAGGQWEFGGPYKPILSFQLDWLSGDDNPSDDKYEAFVSPWEGTSDSYIVENERYGELSELMVGNLLAYKAKIEWSFFNDSLIVHALGAIYTLDSEIGGQDDFGTEYDIGMTWNYDRYTTIKFFTGIFDPGKGYQAAADAYYLRADGTTKDDLIYMLGTNVFVEF